MTDQLMCETDRKCPDWCALDHPAGEARLLHEGRTSSLGVSNRYDPQVPESIDVRAVQYLPDAPPEPEEDWRPFVEVGYHVRQRYRIFNLTPREARQLAAMLSRCAEQADS